MTCSCRTVEAVVKISRFRLRQGVGAGAGVVVGAGGGVVVGGGVVLVEGGGAIDSISIPETTRLISGT